MPPDKLNGIFVKDANYLLRLFLHKSLKRKAIEFEFTYEVSPMESVDRVFDEIPKILCTNGIKMMDPVGFVVSLSICTCNTFPNRSVSDISAR